MKLTMKNQLSFQKAMGYNDDPEPMSIDEVVHQIALWRETVSALADRGSAFSDELTQLESFLFELSYKSEIEYAEPLDEYEFEVIWQFRTPIRVAAKNQYTARSRAIEYFEKNQQGLAACKEYSNTLIFDEDGDEVFDEVNSRRERR